MSERTGRLAITSAVYYRDPKAALEWLEKAFGFQRQMVITDDEGNVGHAEMNFGNASIMVGGEWADWVKSPGSVGGANTQSIHVQLEEDVDAHCARARAAGATIQQEPEDQFYGDRTYRVVDLEGHVWNFGRTIRQVSREEAERASGLNIEGWA
ncbi:MAG: VOC family protein [Dehalococcoidia bacterium]